MLRITAYGDVTRIDLARTLAGRGRYWTTAYAVDGLLIDTGCAHSARELSTALADGPIFKIVNTHTHEDHIGALAFAFGLRHLGDQQHQAVGIALALSAGTFLCISLSDLLPELQFHAHDRLRLSAALLAGVGAACLIGLLESPHIHP